MRSALVVSLRGMGIIVCDGIYTQAMGSLHATVSAQAAGSTQAIGFSPACAPALPITCQAIFAGHATAAGHGTM